MTAHGSRLPQAGHSDWQTPWRQDGRGSRQQWAPADALRGAMQAQDAVLAHGGAAHAAAAAGARATGGQQSVDAAVAGPGGIRHPLRQLAAHAIVQPLWVSIRNQPLVPTSVAVLGHVSLPGALSLKQGDPSEQGEGPRWRQGVRRVDYAGGRVLRML